MGKTLQYIKFKYEPDNVKRRLLKNRGFYMAEEACGGFNGIKIVLRDRDVKEIGDRQI